MKKILNLILLTITTSYYAQSPIIDIVDKDGSRTTNAYYKDVNNLLNTFEGTWLYVNGNKSLKIVMVKKVLQYNGRYYEDLIIGEYEYKVDGIVVISTLDELDNVYSNQRSHSIESNSLIENHHKPPCNDCAVNELRLRASIEDPLQDSYGTMVVRKVMVGSQEAIKIKTRRSGFGHPWMDGTPPPPADFTVPAGEYILIKQ